MLNHNCTNSGPSDSLASSFLNVEIDGTFSRSLLDLVANSKH